ncbi:hypothetical protein QBC39DRAFT_359618, partial [Podospora conica]
MSTNMNYPPQEGFFYGGVMSYDPPNNIDPTLYPVGEYLQNPQRTAFFNGPNNIQATTQDSYHTQAIQPSPPQHHLRFTSPISTNENSYPVALSPPGETEASLVDLEAPATPPDTSVPFGHYYPSQFDPWNMPAHALQFDNMGPPCVNPAEVNSCQPEVYDFENDSFVLARTPSRTSSGDTYLPTTVISSYPARTTVGIPSQIKQEPSCSYPPLPPSGTSERCNDSDDEATISVSLKRKTEETDTDWKPSSPKKSKSNSGPRSSRPKAKTNPNPTSPARKGRKPPTMAANPSQPAYRLATANKGHFLCREPGCAPKQIYTDQSSLDAHIKKKHTRPFKCVFHFAGCPSQFAAKNEWKRHVATQHLLLNYWICQEAECMRLVNGPSPIATNSLSSRTAGSGRTAASTAHHHGHQDEENLPNGNIFNRKDLYTQHLRRMHMPAEYKKEGSGKKTNTTGTTSQQQHAWDARLRALQDAAVRTRCALPEAMTCPAPGCDETFTGATAWDLRMEH